VTTGVAWEDLAGPDRVVTSPLARDTTAEVCVVGMGASGLAAAHRLAERGADVVALDAVGVAAGAAGRNGGFLLAGGSRFHHAAVAAWGHDLAVAVYRASLAELDRTADGPGAEVRRAGSLRIAASPEERDDVAAQLAALRRDGFAAEPYDGTEGRGLLVPDDAAVNPVARCRRAAAAAAAAGARLHAPARVLRLRPGAVVTDAGTVRAARTVLAVDGGLDELLPELAGRVRTARLQMCATAPDPDVTLPRPVYRRWGYDYVQQLPSGEVLLGGCRDRFVETEWDAPPVPTSEVQACLDAALSALGVTAPVTHRWAARAAFTSDGLPVCEKIRPGLVAVGAYSGHGNLLGPHCARAAADASLDGRSLSLRDALGAT
jgi:gamma-glutamylputrescine oxidase